MKKEILVAGISVMLTSLSLYADDSGAPPGSTKFNIPLIPQGGNQWKVTAPPFSGPESENIADVSEATFPENQNFDPSHDIVYPAENSFQDFDYMSPTAFDPMLGGAVDPGSDF